MKSAEYRRAVETMRYLKSPSGRLGFSLGRGIPVDGTCPLCKKPTKQLPEPRNKVFAKFDMPCGPCRESMYSIWEGQHK